jgi:hypothetical protein
MKEIPTGEEVLAGTFSLNEHPVIILFDSGASHDFIGSTCSKKAMLSMVATEAPYMISTPGAWVDADRIVRKAPLELHKATLGIAGRLNHLDSPVYGKIILHLPVISRIKASLHHVAELKLEDILVVQEFLDVFPDDLPGMTPERAIEFKIELQPDTALNAKAPYKMSLVELKELKIQLEGLLDKRYIHPSISPWGCSVLFMEKDKSCVYVWITACLMRSLSRTSTNFHALASCLIN